MNLLATMKPIWSMNSASEWIWRFADVLVLVSAPLLLDCPRWYPLNWTRSARGQLLRFYLFRRTGAPGNERSVIKMSRPS